jgi:hypothetical protein
LLAKSTVTSAVERLNYRKAFHDVAYTAGCLGVDRLLDVERGPF